MNLCRKVIAVPATRAAARRGRAAGFTLIELSIVLVIIGLIVGGILTGQELIKSATVRSEVSELENIETAIYAFRDKYGGLPGDLSNATAFFGTTDSEGLYGSQRRW
jgi:prepilin-type N-terminal cleavage/methylation domain-containing protein